MKKTMIMPRTHEVEEWKTFFKELMQNDPMSPMYVILCCYDMFADELFGVPIPESNPRYFDIGIEIAADDRYPAEEAALAVGFYDEGLDMIVTAAESPGPYQDGFRKAVRNIYSAALVQNWPEQRRVRYAALVK